MFKPSAIVADYETALTDGTPSTEYYRADFRVVSCAFAWRTADGTVKTKYTVGEDETGAYLARISAAGIPVIVHNLQFEYGVTRYRFPWCEVDELLVHDTMRYAQVADNGGKLAHYGTSKVQTYDDLLDSVESGDDGSSYATGLGLVACASRFLPAEYHNHKEPYHSWLREHCGVKKGQEGRHLTSLPADMLEAYNVADAVVTLNLYEALWVKFEAEGYDPSNDHVLYSSSARFMSLAKGTGLPVDSATLHAYTAEIQAEVDAIEARFRQHFAEAIDKIEDGMGLAWVMELKSEKGRANRARQLAEDPSLARFNIGSGKQLARLFVDVLGVTPQFWTKPPKAKKGVERKKEFVPSPSFKSAHLHTYGEGGEIIKARRKRLLVLQQARALLKLSEWDGLWHFDLRACGTATGRFSGGRAE